MQPTVGVTWSPEEQSQIDALMMLYNNTNMGTKSSLRFHNWFTIDKYCDFTGVDCDSNGYVTSIDLTNSRLSGNLPSSLEALSELRTLKLVGNSIGGLYRSSLPT